MIPPQLTSQLALAADSALLPILQQGAPFQNKPRHEVGFVAAAVLGGVPAIANAWRPILQPVGYQLKISGVFCHQAPEATFTDLNGVTRSCELADLLLVVEDLTSATQNRRWATLIQAKMAAAKGGKTITEKRDLRQLDLFTRWPAFKLPSGYCSKPRDFSTCSYSGTTLDCGSYGLINKQPNPKWHQQAPAKTMPPGGHQLGSFLAHMLTTGLSGFGREATGTGDDWSRTVEDLMNVTFTKAFNYATGFGQKSQSRGKMAMAFMEFDGWHREDHMNYIYIGDFPPSGWPPEYPEEGDPEGNGISILRVGIMRDGMHDTPRVRRWI